MVDDDAPQPHREYRIDELAEAAGLPNRTVRYYRERRLLPPPRREGRIGWYSDAHLARLRVITRLLERGHTLEGVAELLAAWERGRDVADLLGLESALAAPWSDPTPVTMTWAELARTYAGQVDADTVRSAQELGYLEDGEDGTVHVDRAILHSSSGLVREGIPLEAVLAASPEVQRHADDLAGLFVDLVRRHLTPRPGEGLKDLARRVERLRPLAQATVLAEFARAMDRRVGAELGSLLAELRERAAGDQEDDPHTR
ncbi:MerR family transcriptional regulator [Marinactinospora thermotolerans]|uniref:Predicted transcriptional regulators n=1 Tax=Marinactinospora thermotolerans DSM 45154 TaxID=1122192 RepID=A0A1T4PCL2_9ACTN|nr:MerR family transcriptional regulator [Marinactinospora thermotolerans]SJZ88568.1 Predicted transcriptional regulators [Marinactinospora thermotolerans DSM 45154]